MGTTATTYRVTGFCNATALIVAHLRGLRGETLVPGDVNRITYSVWRLANNGANKEEIEGHSNIELPLKNVFFELQKKTYMSDGEMVSMDVNFEHQIDNETFECFPERGAKYLVRYDIYPADGFVSPIQYVLEAQ